MDKTYNAFLKLGISLTPLGIETREDNTAYFCTPKGASIIGWAGVDGIHYCRIRGFGDMIFAVSPMNGSPNYVHPIAENFEILLRLLLACGDAAALEQAWQWSEARFNEFLAENPPTEDASTVIGEIAEKLNLSPMENPWKYIRLLQKNFDYDKIRYTEDIVDPDMNQDAEISAPEWKVYFQGSFWGRHGRSRAGAEICIDKEFDWAGCHWLIPSAYSCSGGLVIDFCMQVSAEKIRSFMEKWNLCQENDSVVHFTREEQMELDLDNPLFLNFTPIIEVNGCRISASQGCSVVYNPCMPDGLTCELEAKWTVDHYGLDPDCGWVFFRYNFPWRSKRRPEIKTLSVTVEQQPEQIPGPHFKVHAPGDTFRFVHPVSGTEYTLTMRESEKQIMQNNHFLSDLRYPTHFTVMSYTISPQDGESITVSDCDDGDNPRMIAESEHMPSPSATGDAACIGVIGGADGPTAIIFGGSSQGRLCTACSALHFEPVQDDIEWRITFRHRRFEPFSINLYNCG